MSSVSAPDNLESGGTSPQPLPDAGRGTGERSAVPGGEPEGAPHRPRRGEGTGGITAEVARPEDGELEDSAPEGERGGDVGQRAT